MPRGLATGRATIEVELEREHGLGGQRALDQLDQQVVARAGHAGPDGRRDTGVAVGADASHGTVGHDRRVSGAS
jgi:hypothetical protein